MKLKAGQIIECPLGIAVQPAENGKGFMTKIIKADKVLGRKRRKRESPFFAAFDEQMLRGPGLVCRLDRQPKPGENIRIVKIKGKRAVGELVSS